MHRKNGRYHVTIIIRIVQISLFDYKVMKLPTCHPGVDSWRGTGYGFLQTNSTCKWSCIGHSLQIYHKPTSLVFGIIVDFPTCRQMSSTSHVVRHNDIMNTSCHMSQWHNKYAWLEPRSGICPNDFSRQIHMQGKVGRWWVPDLQWLDHAVIEGTDWNNLAIYHFYVLPYIAVHYLLLLWGDTIYTCKVDVTWNLGNRYLLSKLVMWVSQNHKIAQIYYNCPATCYPSFLPFTA